MKLLVESAMIFFGTLLAAGVVALGEPRDHTMAHALPQWPAPHEKAQVVATAPKLPNDAAQSQPIR